MQRRDNDQNQMCLVCHSPRDVQSADDGSHPVGVAIPALGDFQLPAGLPLASTDQVVCMTCHDVHLADSGVRFYGAYWCPRCEEQKALFEASAERLPYVECSPGGRQGPKNAACTVRNIRDYPTWIIDGRRSTGVISVAELARASGFEQPTEAPAVE